MIKVETLFGEGSYQDENFLVINKSSLDISESSNNSAESLFAAIILRASKQYVGVFTDESNSPVTDHEGNNITFDNRILFDSTKLAYYDRYLPVGIIRDVFEFLEYVS